MTAHYIATKRRKFVVISQDMRPIGVEIDVSGLVEARKVAKANGAKPWNF